MNLQEETHGAVTVVRPDGAITQTESDSFREQLKTVRERTYGRLVIDASEIPFIDSEGLEALADLGAMLSERGQALKICCVTEVVREVLELTDLASTFEQFEDVNAAVRSFR